MKERETLNEALDEDLREEIRRRVMERHYQREREERLSEQNAADIEALHEITLLSKEEIESIALEVQNDLAQNAAHEDQEAPGESRGRSRRGEMTLQEFENLSPRQRRKVRVYYMHLLGYISGGIAGVSINAAVADVPWVLIGLAPWTFGLIAHYLKAVRWPKSDIRRRVKSVKNEIRSILRENWHAFGEPGLLTARRQKPFANGVYRLLLSGASAKEIADYLATIEHTIDCEFSSEANLERIGRLVTALRKRFIETR